jgi:hypothetical protein
MPGDEANEAFADDGVGLVVAVVLVQLSAVAGSLCVCCLLTPAMEDHDAAGDKLIRTGNVSPVHPSRATRAWKRVHLPLNISLRFLVLTFSFLQPHNYHATAAVA